MEAPTKDFLGGAVVGICLPMLFLLEAQETRVRSMGQGDSLEKETAAHSGILA